MIELQHATFRYEAMAMDFDITAPKGSFTAIIGPSGGGKSTLLSLIAGFEVPLSGRIVIDGKDMAGVAPSDRPVSMIFQDNNVFTHFDIWQNVAIGLSPGLKLTAGQRELADDALIRVGLSDLRTNRERLRPREITAGRQPMREALSHFDLQRVVPGLAHRIPVDGNSGELWEGPQSLSQRLVWREADVWRLETTSHNTGSIDCRREQCPVACVIYIKAK